MLPLKQPFFLKYTINRPSRLVSPRVIPPNNQVLPRGSIFHDIELGTTRYFPVREGVLHNEIADNRKLFVDNVVEYMNPDGRFLIGDRTVSRQIRRWFIERRHMFRPRNIVEMGSPDFNAPSIINYNLLKKAFKYPKTPISHYHEYINTMGTVFGTVAKMCENQEADKDHFVPITLPSIVPAFQVFDRLLKMTDIRRKRLINDSVIRIVLDMLLWVNNDTRSQSCFRDLTPEKAERVTLIIKHRDYVTYLPLKTIINMSDQNEASSQIKLTPFKIQKLVVRFLKILQNTVDAKYSDDTEEKGGEGSGEEEGGEERVNDPYNDYDDDPLSKTSAPNDDTHDEEENELHDHLQRTENELESVKLTENVEDEENEINAALDEDAEMNSFDIQFIKHIEHLNDEIEKSKTSDSEEETLDEVEETAESVTEEYSSYFNTLPLESVNQKVVDLPADQLIQDQLDDLLRNQLITPAEYKSLIKLRNARSKMPSPYDENEGFDEYADRVREFLKVDPEKTKIKCKATPVPETYKKSRLQTLDSEYIKNGLRRDIVGSLRSLERAGYIIKDHHVELSPPSVLGRYEVHKVVIKPLRGVESSLFLKIPVINKEGEFYASGIKMRLRKQLTETPIRKTSPFRVVLSSNSNKLFIQLSERKQFNVTEYLNSTIKKMYMTEDQTDIKELVLKSVFDSELDQPYMLGALSQVFSVIEISQCRIELDKSERVKGIPEEEVNRLLQSGYYPCGRSSSNLILVCDKEGVFHTVQPSGGFERLGDMFELLGIPSQLIPIPFSDIRILGKVVPLGVVLGYYLGLSGLMKYLGVNPKILPAKKRYTLEAGEWSLNFSDVKLIFSDLTYEQTYLLGGYQFYSKFLKGAKVRDFDDKLIYLPLLEFRGLGINHLKELDVIRSLFLDHITITALEEMDEPTEFIPLLMRANQLLTTIQHPPVNKTSHSLLRGYDRVPGLMYRVLSRAVRNHMFRGTSRSKVELDPYAVWNAIVGDNTHKNSEDVNPTMDMKEAEAVTLLGTDGLSKEVVSMKLRVYDKSHMGGISESTVDSGDVAINTFTTWDPKISSLRGNFDATDKGYMEDPGRVLSTSSILIPGIEYDDQQWSI